MPGSAAGAQASLELRSYPYKSQSLNRPQAIETGVWNLWSSRSLFWQVHTHSSIDAFKLWCWRRLLRGPWTVRRSSQSILKEINPEHSFIRRTDAEAETPIFWPPDVKNQLTEKTLILGKIEGRRIMG